MEVPNNLMNQMGLKNIPPGYERRLCNLEKIEQKMFQELENIIIRHPKRRGAISQNHRCYVH
jgi:hypothetical protein